ncbi:MAG: hypothetical protein GY783_14495 [Gammaproteobacteria bacterium]|nr:hypothetical protein [Gammaproteobacteria bacterium]
MMRAMRTITALILVLLLTMAAQAQDDAVEEAEEIRRYTVEMIIFKYAQEVAPGSEIFPGDKPVPAPEPLEQDPFLEEELPLEELPAVFRDVELVLLGDDEYTMGETMGRLERLEVYDPIMHFGWTQTTWPEEETRAIELGSLARLPMGLDGNLTLYLSRYLHLVVDLQLDAPDSATRNFASDDRMSSFGDYRTLDEFGGIDEPGPVRYRIRENRILRSGELRYFDHPKFGVLAKVTRVEEEEPSETEETELLGYPIE